MDLAPARGHDGAAGAVEKRMTAGGSVIAADWPAPASVRAVCTTRRGGMSHRPFDSLNIAEHVDDEPRLVRENRRLLRNELQLPAEPVWLDQRHGRQVVHVDDEVDQPVGDASVARSPGRVCAVMTADCLPVLLCDTAGTRVAAVHAGWRGLVAGVIEAAVVALDPRGRGLMAWLGPAIGPEAYEIDEPVYRRLVATDPGAGDALRPVRAGHWYADLYALARRRLGTMGVDAVYGGNFCTFSDSARFFSYRRDGRCGRMASLIWLES